MDEGLANLAKKKRARRIRRALLTAVLILAVLGTAGYFLSEKFFVVTVVEIQTTPLYSDEALREALDIGEKTPFLSLSKKEISSALEENFPYLVDVAVHYRLPHTLSVTFTEKFGELGLRLGGDLFAVDRDLNVIAREKTDSPISRIPFLCRDISRCVVGEKLHFFEEDVEELMKNLIRALDETELFSETKRIDITDKFDVRIVLSDRFEVLLGENENFAYKLALVREVIRDLPAGETARIDAADENSAYVSLTPLTF